MNCEICGAFEENLIPTEIEGAVMNLCKDCSKYGKSLAGPASNAGISKTDPIYGPMLKENFADIIREEIDKRGMSSEELADSIKCSPGEVKKIIKGSLLPNADIAGKMEKFLGIRLYEDDIGSNLKLISKDSSLSFGDVVEIKKRT